MAEAKKVKGKVLEIAVGTGRIFLELLKNRTDAYGIDISEAMLKQLREKARKNKIDLGKRVSRQNMQNFSLKEKFDLVIIPYRAFLHNLTTREQLATLRCCKKHLKKGGKLILNFFHFSPVFVAKRLQGKRMPPAKIKNKNYSLKIFEKSEYDFQKQKIKVTFLFEEKIGKRPVKKFKDGFFLSWINLREFQLLAKEAGFKIKNLFGNFKKAPFRNHSDELIWILEK